MSREEDLIRSTTHAIAVTVREVPPLHLEPAPGAPRSPARAPRRLRGGSGRQRRWRSWAPPLTAAAVVVALAVSLVLVRDIPNDGAVSPNPTNSTGPGGAPRYYVALTQFGGDFLHNTEQNGIVVGDSLTGERIAKFAPPAHTTFQIVMAAADDLTFVVFAVTSPTGKFLPTHGVTLTGSWYVVRLAPGTANPARLTRLPIKPWSWASTAGENKDPAPGHIWAMALSQSGRELAVGDIPDIPAATKPLDWQEVKVFSVATGRLLHDWTENDPNAWPSSVLDGTSAGYPLGASALTWIDGDQALTLATSRLTSSGTVTGTVRRLDVAGPATGNLKTDSTVLWSGALSWNDGHGCYAVSSWPPMVSADGKTVSCTNHDELKSDPSRGMASFVTDPLPPGPAADIKPRIDYQVRSPVGQNGKPLAGGTDTSLLWVSPSADTLIAVWHYIENRPPATGAHFGVISHGKFIPLRLPSSLGTAYLGEIAW